MQTEAVSPLGAERPPLKAGEEGSASVGLGSSLGPGSRWAPLARPLWTRVMVPGGLPGHCEWWPGRESRSRAWPPHALAVLPCTLGFLRRSATRSSRPPGLPLMKSRAQGPRCVRERHRGPPECSPFSHPGPSRRRVLRPESTTDCEAAPVTDLDVPSSPGGLGDSHCPASGRDRHMTGLLLQNAFTDVSHLCM